jgi:hypothetical protein
MGEIHVCLYPAVYQINRRQVVFAASLWKIYTFLLGRLLKTATPIMIFLKAPGQKMFEKLLFLLRG